MAKFQPGNGGRPKNARNKLSHDFIADLAAEWSEHGRDAIRIMRIERPSEFVKVVGSLMPDQLEITDNSRLDITDADLDLVLEYARRQLTSGPLGDVGGGEETAEGGEQARVLLPVPKAT